MAEELKAPEDSWYDYSYLAQYIEPRIKLLREKSHGYPYSLSPEEWDKILGKIHRAMYLIVHGDNWDMEEKSLDEVKEGCELLGKWFVHLWD